MSRCWNTKLQAAWYTTKPTWLWSALWPLSIVYALIVKIRRLLYKVKLLPSYKLSVPTIIVGNITVGGTGKTPLVIYLLDLLTQQGFKPGVISRGYKGSSRHIMSVTATSDPSYVGDEPVLIAKRSNCPVVVGKDRHAAGQYLIRNFSVDVVISDDGLQHYALQRDVEIIVIDGVRRFGNGHFLPLGPLRESSARLQQADLLVVNGGNPAAKEFAMQLEYRAAYNLLHLPITKSLAEFIASPVHAVAAIGSPTRFFNLLRQNGLQIIEHAFLDHHNFIAQDLEFADNYPVLLTEKDAVKCKNFAKPNFWCLPIAATFNQDFVKSFLQLLNKVKDVR